MHHEWSISKYFKPSLIKSNITRKNCGISNFCGFVDIEDTGNESEHLIEVQVSGFFFCKEWTFFTEETIYGWILAFRYQALFLTISHLYSLVQIINTRANTSHCKKVKYTTENKLDHTSIVLVLEYDYTDGACRINKWPTRSQSL